MNVYLKGFPKKVQDAKKTTVAGRFHRKFLQSGEIVQTGKFA